MYSQPFVPTRHDPEEERLRQERRAARQMRRKQQRRARFLLWFAIIVCALLLGLAGFTYLQVENTMTKATLYPPISGLSCDSAEQTGYHIHIHMTIYINGKALNIPSGIGIASDGSCLYWMHTHAEDGIIHIEAPGKVHNVALDDFMTLWQQGFAKLNFPPQVLQRTGWQIWVNGKPFNGVVTSPLYTEVQFNSHDAVTLEYGTPNPPPDTFYPFPANLPK